MPKAMRPIRRRVPVGGKLIYLKSILTAQRLALLRSANAASKHAWASRAPPASADVSWLASSCELCVAIEP